MLVSEEGVDRFFRCREEAAMTEEEKAELEELRQKAM